MKIKCMSINWDRCIAIIGVLIGFIGFYFGFVDQKKSEASGLIDLYYEVVRALDYQQTLPNTVETLIVRGQALSADFDMVSAWQAIKKIEVIDPGSEAVTGLKLMYISRLHSDELIRSHLDELSNELPEAGTKFMFGLFISRDKDRGKEALQYMEEAVSLDPKNLEMKAMFGLQLHSFGENEEAIKQLNSVLSIRNNIYVLNKLAHVLVESEEYDRAFSLLSEAIASSAANAETFGVMGYMFGLKNEFEQSIEYYLKASSLEFQDGKYHRNLSLLFEVVDNKNEAEKHKRLADKYGWPVPAGADVRSLID